MAMLLAMSTASGQDVDGFAELRLQACAGVDADVPLTMVERFRPTFSAPMGERVFHPAPSRPASARAGTPSTRLWIWSKEDLSPALLDLLGDTEDDNDLLHISGASDYLSVDRIRGPSPRKDRAPTIVVTVPRFRGAWSTAR